LKEISIIIDRNSKTKILQYLSKVIGLTEENIYPDLSGFALANATEKPTKFANQSEILPFAIELYWKKEYEKALPYFDRVIQQKPSAEAYFFSAQTKEKLGDKAGAETDYTQSIKLNPTAEAYNNRGNLRYVLKRYQEAEADFNEAIKLKPALAEAYSNRGNAIKALRLVSRYQEAEADFNEAIKLKPNFARAYNNLGNLYLIWNKKNEAKQDYEQALKLAQQQNNQKEIKITLDNLDKLTSHSGSQK
jgi:tetratricopeptide (TPR) repeat protein